MRRPRSPIAWLAIALLVVGGALAARSATRPPPGDAGPGRLVLGLERPLRVETVASGLDTPWDLAWGPDGAIWVTERPGRISRVDPATGEVTVVGEVDVVEVSESGLMGLALHPDFAAEPWVYLAYTARERGRTENRIARLRYEGGRLGDPEVLVSGLPAAGNHNGSRLAIGPDGYLYATTGDASERDRAHDLSSPAGKILRLTLDGRPAPDNPFGSAVWSWGHRNPQGLVFHPSTGVLYSAEHGPGTDDEVNRIVAGGDYGWPEVRGFCDAASGEEEEYCRRHEVVEPLYAWTPTVGASGLDVYVEGEAIPAWTGSLLMTSLRAGALFRLPLDADGAGVTGVETVIRGQYGRLRDVLVGPRGEVYLATSNRDGRGRPAEEDDRILRLTAEP